MNLVVSLKQTKLIAAGTSLCFLGIHVAMLVLFFLCGVTPMAWFNVFSILFYVGTFALIHREHFSAYVVAVYVEVVLHMALAVVFVGWNAGFQITLLGMCILAFFAEYMGRTMGVHHVSGSVLCLVGMCAYLGILAYSHTNPAPYALPPNVEFWLEVAWCIIVFAIDISFLQLFVIVTFESEKVLSSRLAHDKLTGLPNRYYMANYMHDLENGKGLDGCWLAMADIDNFKKVNDTYGHNCGDYVLSEVAHILAGETSGAEICRWGGEEFLLVGSGDYAMLDHAREAVQDHSFCYEDERLWVTITIGVATYEEGQTADEWINQADQRLYEGKLNGKNQVVSQ